MHLFCLRIAYLSQIYICEVLLIEILDPSCLKCLSHDCGHFEENHDKKDLAEIYS